jgi:uncharacterized protein YbbC (DUF1343 family)
MVGADRLFNEFKYLIDGKKVALVSNHTGRLSDGTHLADLLFRYPETELKVLFGMNYNIRTNDYSLSPDQERDLDPETGLVKFSLYGKNHKPTSEMLEGVDVIIIDIQEVGARFYEHINILGFVMEAAAENNVEVVVLDRPNPITGSKIDGFITDDEFLYSFGAFGKVPIIHGMTMGEIANMYNGEGMLRGGKKSKLHIVKMTGWQRNMWLDQTGLPWIKLSPNLPNHESMLVYNGTCIFEGLNLSTGRGTEKPFQYIGSPWLDNEKAASILNDLGLPGVWFDTLAFTPVKMPFHSQPPFLAGESCKGIFIRVTDRSVFEPYKVGVSLLWAINRIHPEKIKWNLETIYRLTGTRRLNEMITNGAHPTEIFNSWEQELLYFSQLRLKYLLY